MYILKTVREIDGAHFLPNYNGKCSNIHGHRWRVEVEIVTEDLIDDMVIDFTELKRVIDEFDHKLINDLVEFRPTAENISKYYHDKIVALRDNIGVTIKVYETPDNSIEYLS